MTLKSCAAVLTAAIATVLFASHASAAPKASKATPAEVAEFWAKVFKGPQPHGVPPLNAERTNQRTVANATLWDVRFDSYRDPDTNKPVRLAGVLGVPNQPGRKFPGLVVTHSVGAPYPAPDNIEEMATFFAGKGYVTLGFFMRGWGTSRMAKVNTDSPLGRMDGFYVANLVDDGEEPFNNVWAGFPVDMYQAGEFLAAQPEVSDPNALAVAGHSGGGYAALMAGIFNKRFKVIAASAPAATSADLDGWMTYWKNSPWRRWADTQPDPALAMLRATRTWSYTGAYQALNNPHLVAKDRNWKLKNTAVWFYGGENDVAVPADDVEAAWRLADSSNQKVLQRSPSGGHGGPETWQGMQTWLAGHYPGRTYSAPKADLRIITQRSGAVILSGERSASDSGLVAWEYDFGDGTVRHWGSTIGHTYRRPGSYTAKLTVTNGAGKRDTATVRVRTTESGPAAPASAEGAAASANAASAPAGASQIRISLADATAKQGDAVFVPITISGTENVAVTSFSVTMEFDNKVFLQQRVVRGPAVPGPAWWNFSGRPETPGVQTISAEEFVAAPAPVLNGVAAQLGLTVAERAAPGTYPVKIVKASINNNIVTSPVHPATVRIEAKGR